jgi:hypothetical protein
MSKFKFFDGVERAATNAALDRLVNNKKRPEHFDDVLPLAVIGNAIPRGKSGL